uniref:Uncharacterized protein n=1 Tax=virus sp. ctEfN2 TaxID=2825810 RepID=A0A8S5RMZ7_9VIRU|nr:MAG TPA: hypothetical protein [virus sp. ctEfN2]DAH05507.1 MAG TPA: hypothetical protein [Bacteriophage sp.]DAZ83691.1 MAG TPA: hypothetical protein [Caudoviricetes sp.]
MIKLKLSVMLLANIVCSIFCVEQLGCRQTSS